jgi:hypothetical protein
MRSGYTTCCIFSSLQHCVDRPVRPSLALKDWSGAVMGLYTRACCVRYVSLPGCCRIALIWRLTRDQAADDLDGAPSSESAPTKIQQSAFQKLILEILNSLLA